MTFKTFVGLFASQVRGRCPLDPPAKGGAFGID